MSSAKPLAWMVAGLAITAMMFAAYDAVSAKPGGLRGIVNPVRGGRIYDKWFTELPAAAPSTDHPLWQFRPDLLSNSRTGSDTWRCKECHGWDYKGVDGVYGSGSHRTGIAGILNSTMNHADMFTLLREPPSNGGTTGVLNGHDYGSVMTDADIDDVVEFAQTLLIDPALFLDGSNNFIGDEAAGEVNYVTGGGVLPVECISCHGSDGTNLNFGTFEDPEWVGTIAVDNPWELMHKIRMGQPGVPMPSWTEFGGSDQGVADIGKYAQINFPVAPCAGDLSGDHTVVDFNDLLALFSFWGPCPGICPGDFTGPGSTLPDGIVDFNDLLALFALWGTCP